MLITRSSLYNETRPSEILIHDQSQSGCYTFPAYSGEIGNIYISCVIAGESSTANLIRLVRSGETPPS